MKGGGDKNSESPNWKDRQYNGQRKRDKNTTQHESHSKRA